MLIPQYSEAGSQTRYLMPDAVESVQPSDVEGWGSQLRFKSGRTWTIRTSPEKLAEKISVKQTVMNSDSS